MAWHVLFVVFACLLSCLRPTHLSTHSCLQAYGKCDSPWMLAGNYCAATCGRCPAGEGASAPAAAPAAPVAETEAAAPAPACADVPPPETDMSCAEQKVCGWVGGRRWGGGGGGWGVSVESGRRLPALACACLRFACSCLPSRVPVFHHLHTHPPPSSCADIRQVRQPLDGVGQLLRRHLRPLPRRRRRSSLGSSPRRPTHCRPGRPAC